MVTPVSRVSYEPATTDTVTLELSAPLAARLRAFLQNAYVGNDFILLEGVYSPLLTVLKQVGLDTLCSVNDFDADPYQMDLPFPPN